MDRRSTYSSCPIKPEPSVHLIWVSPFIVTQPTDQTATAGQNASFSVTASGGTAPLYYQWYFNSGSVVSATNATLTLTNVQDNNAGTYYVVVGDSLGSVTSSNAVLTVTDPPATMSGLKLWLRGNAGVTNSGNLVSQWSDQTTNNNNATQGNSSFQPLYVTNVLNGYPVVRFNGTNSFFSLPTILGGTIVEAEAFLILRVATNLPSGQHMLWQVGQYNGSVYYGRQAYPDTDGTINDCFGSTGLQIEGYQPQSLTQYHMYDAVSQAGNWAAWINGILAYQTTNNAVGFDTHMQLGRAHYNLGSASSGTGYFAGDISEILVFSRVLTTSERMAVNIYLNGKYGLVPAVPTTPSNLVATAISPTQVSLTLG